MNSFTLPPLEGRLQQRYHQLLLEHLAPAHAVAAGLRALQTTSSAFASTQAAWRFYRNDRVELPDLAEPLVAHARQGLDERQPHWRLIVHDWSNLHYNGHDGKDDRIPLTRKRDLGYRLLSQLLLDDRDGQPLAPVGLHLQDRGGVWSTRWRGQRPEGVHLDDLDEHMQALQAQWGASGPLVHIIDAQADSVGHYRQWHKQGHFFLVRADAQPRVRYHDQTMPLAEVAQRLQEGQAFVHLGSVKLRDRQVQQWAAEVEVVLERPARKHRVDAQGVKRHKNVPGEPLALRLVVAQLRGADGQVEGQWLLLTNLPAEVATAQVVQWYTWRWRIESFFKLLKGAGLRLEQWKQQTGRALSRRLLVAAMACVVVWHLARSDAPESSEIRDLLVRLSGRQMAWGKAFTEPALLAGLWVLLSLLQTLQTHSPEQLEQLARLLLPMPPPRGKGKA